MNFDLHEALNNFNSKNANEIENLNKIKKFLSTNDNCFSRTNLKGHITAGALIIDKNCNVLLNHHKTLDKWIHFGGHSDGDSNSLNVAKREVLEETGISDFDDMNGQIFDIDVHIIPENSFKKEPVHYHYDIRFLFIAKNADFQISDESLNIKWLPITEAKKQVTDSSMIRMLDKAYALYMNKDLEK